MSDTALPLKLIALDADDLAIVSTHLQDAIVKTTEIAWLAGDKRLVLVCNRFDWPAGSAGEPRRRRTGLRIDRVRAVKARGIARGSETILSLMALRFEPAAEAPAGTVELVFAAGKTLRLEVDCIEAAMDDLGPMWATDLTPDHGDAAS